MEKKKESRRPLPKMTDDPYPYDLRSRNEYGGNPTKTLRDCYNLAFELMELYEPFGQSASAYESTGYPEMVAIGIRTFLSTSANLHMMRDLGKATLENLAIMGIVGSDRRMGSPFQMDNWKIIKKELHSANKRTYDSVMDDIKEKRKNIKFEKREK